MHSNASFGGISHFQQKKTVSTVHLSIDQSSDLSEWSPVLLTPEMIGEDGMIHLEPSEGSAYFRMRLDVPSVDVTPDPSAAEMVLVHSGTLLTSNSLNSTQVSTFYIAKCEVTWAEWKAVRSWAAWNGYDLDTIGAGCADNHPVHMVNWYDVVKWSNAKSEMEGLTPVYMVDDLIYRKDQFGRYGSHVVKQNAAANGYRLPLEAEWEFAARGGNQTDGYIYAGSNDLKAVAWYRDNSEGGESDLSAGRGTWPVGQKAANELGVYDMSGNVWEWCWDLSGSFRHVRGGGWEDFPSFCAVSGRSSFYPHYRYNNRGFRLARNAES